MGSVSDAMLLAAESGPHLPSVSDFLPPEILFEGTPFAINRIILVRLVATVIMLTVLIITARRAKVIPGRWQAEVEWLLDYIRDNIIYQVMGPIRGRRYVPMITTIFMTVFIFNLCGIIPGMNIAATASVVMPLAFALWVFVQYWRAGIKEHGLGGFLKEELLPAGVPWPIYIILTPVQLLELVLIRPISLTVRLFANMVAGHLLVATCYAFTQFYLIESAGAAVKVGGALWLCGGLVFTCFEMFVAALQAYVFAILATVYINQSYPEAE